MNLMVIVWKGHMIDSVMSTVPPVENGRLGLLSCNEVFFPKHQTLHKPITTPTTKL